MRSLRDRIMAKVDVPRDIHRCWLWTGALSRKRYDQRRPYVWLDGKAQNVARIVCAWVNGPAPSSAHHAGHTCPDGENELCVSPLHLVWQSPQENQAWKLSRRSSTPSAKCPADSSGCAA